MRRHVENGSHFIDAWIEGTVFVRREGAIGTVGKVTRVDAGHSKIAESRLLQYLFHQRAYRTVFLPPPATPRNPTLEAAVREGDPQVYADWLLEQGSPLGEQIAHDRAGWEPDSYIANATWRRGLWDSLRVELFEHQNYELDLVTLVRPLFAAALCCALDELRVGMLHWGDQVDDHAKLLAEAGTHAWAASLPRLRLGDVADDIDLAHHYVGDLEIISHSFPGLRSLEIRSGGDNDNELVLAGLALPKLERFVLETCELTPTRLRDLLVADLPSLRELVLWFGSGTHNHPATVDDVAPLFALPLTQLGLCNTLLSNELIAPLARSPMAGRLTRLDLSRGTLDDNGAAALVGHAGKFSRLRELDVDQNYLSAEAIEELRRHFGNAISKAQKPDDGERFVSVAE